MLAVMSVPPAANQVQGPAIHVQGQRILDLMRERGWAGWTRLERLAEPPD